MELSTLIHAVKQWVEKGDFLNSCVRIQVICNSEITYRAILHFKECMAQILISPSDFAPRRYITFEVVALVNNLPQTIFVWNDCENDNIDSILRHLNDGIIIAMKHNGCLAENRKDD